MNQNRTILFQEEQKFRTNLLIFLLIVGMLLPIGVLFYSMSIEQLRKTEFTLSTFAIVAFEIPIFALFYYTKLETMVTEEGFAFRWWPLQKTHRMIFKDEIVEVSSRSGPWLSYGIHWMPLYGWVHNVRGREGIQFKLRSGKRIFFGTQKIDELKTALQHLLNRPIGDFRNEF